MMTYEKPNAEWIEFEGENIMTNLGPGLGSIEEGDEDL